MALLYHWTDVDFSKGTQDLANPDIIEQYREQKLANGISFEGVEKMYIQKQIEQGHDLHLVSYINAVDFNTESLKIKNGFLVKIMPRDNTFLIACLLYTSPSPRDRTRSRMPSSA